MLLGIFTLRVVLKVARLALCSVVKTVVVMVVNSVALMVCSLVDESVDVWVVG